MGGARFAPTASVALALLVAMTSLGAQPQTPSPLPDTPPATRSVSGRLVDAVTGDAISGPVGGAERAGAEGVQQVVVPNLFRHTVGPGDVALPWRTGRTELHPAGQAAWLVRQEIDDDRRDILGSEFPIRGRVRAMPAKPRIDRTW